MMTCLIKNSKSYQSPHVKSDTICWTLENFDSGSRLCDVISGPLDTKMRIHLL